MNKGTLGTTDNLRTKRFYHGTRSELRPGDLIEPSNPPDFGEQDRRTALAKILRVLGALCVLVVNSSYNL